MSKSEHVKAWRKRTKQRIVEAMGGKCVCCGYNKCLPSLALHHLDPTQKDFTFGAIRANPKSWNKIVEELRKCVLVCHNCHNEIHEGITDLPNNYPKFNEEYSSYQDLIPNGQEPKKIKHCKQCNKEIKNQYTYCSDGCAKKVREKIIWPSNEELVALLEISNYSRVAKQLGVSDNAIRHRLHARGLS